MGVEMIKKYYIPLAILLISPTYLSATSLFVPGPLYRGNVVHIGETIIIINEAAGSKLFRFTDYYTLKGVNIYCHNDRGILIKENNISMHENVMIAKDCGEIYKFWYQNKKTFYVSVESIRLKKRLFAKKFILH